MPLMELFIGFLLVVGKSVQFSEHFTCHVVGLVHAVHQGLEICVSFHTKGLKGGGGGLKEEGRVPGFSKRMNFILTHFEISYLIK